MRMKLLTILIIMSISVAYCVAQAQVNGYIMTDNRLRISEPRNWTWNENELSLKLDTEASEKAHAFAEMRFRNWGFPSIGNVADLQEKSRRGINPYSVDIYEAYVDVYGFLMDQIDLRIGKQVIVWGTADKINPSSNLCPDDLEDIFNFGEKVGVNAFKASFYQKVKGTELKLTGVFIPVFTPSILPSNEWSSLFTAKFKMPLGMELGSYSDKIIMPDRSIGETSSCGFKLSSKLLGYDISVGYYSGHEKLPVVTKVLFLPEKESQNKRANVTAYLEYPKMQVVSMDIAGEIFSTGFWAESAVFMPKEEISTQLLLMPSGVSLGKMIALDDKPYVKFVVGADYNFPKGFYLNVQYVHGFLHERGKENLNEYILPRLEYKFHRDEIKLVPISFAFEFDKLKEIKDNYGFVYMPEVVYSPYDSVELALGLLIIDGKGSNIFKELRKNDEIHIRAKISF